MHNVGRRKITAAVATAIAIAVVLSGCSSSDDGNHLDVPAPQRLFVANLLRMQRRGCWLFRLVENRHGRTSQSFWGSRP